MRSSPLAVLALAPLAHAQCLLTHHAPPPFSSSSSVRAVYHSGLHQVLAVETYSLTQVRIWAWDGSAWSLLAAGGPSPREYAGVAYDSARDRLILFGGVVGAFGYRSDTWEWDRTSWTERILPGPSPRSHHGMVYDEARQRTVLFGGYHQPPFVTYGDTWEWDGQSWIQLASTGPGPSSVTTPMVYDPVRNLTLLSRSSGGAAQLWEWNGIQWSQYPGPIPSSSVSWIVYDRGRSRLVFGGYGITDFDPATGQSMLRQPGIGIAGPAAYDVDRSLTLAAAASATLEYNGAATETSPYFLAGSTGGGSYSIGATVALAAQPGGSEPLTYQWRRDGTPVLDGGHISGATTPFLTIVGATIHDSGSYDLVATNACAAATTWATSVEIFPSCYANCDGSTTPPILNVNDFVCFQTQFAAGHIYANCDESWTAPMLNVNDFLCFMVRFSQGCP